MSIAGLRILVADDEQDTLALLEICLEAQGASVHLAAEGQEAMRILVEERPDLVLLDLSMPGITGYELLEQARSNPELAGVVFLAFTAHADSKERERAKAAGFHGFVAKPVNLSDLLEVLVSAAPNK